MSLAREAPVTSVSWGVGGQEAARSSVTLALMGFREGAGWAWGELLYTSSLMGFGVGAG